MATFTNTASLLFNGNTIRSNIVTGEIADVLTATKTAVADTYTAGGAVTYAVSIVNAGDTAANDLTLTDNLGAYDFDGTTLYPLDYTAGSVRYYANGVLQPAPAVTGDQPLVITGIDVPAGGNAMILYEAQTNDFAPLTPGSEIVNEADVTGDSVYAPLMATASVSAAEEPVLSIIKALSPDTVTENEEITYTFTVQNAGSTAVTATDGVVLNDLFDPIIAITSVTFNGTAWQSPAQYTMDTSTGAFSTVAGQITVPAATYTQNPDTGEWEMTPGTSVLTVTGII